MNGYGYGLERFKQAVTEKLGFLKENGGFLAIAAAFVLAFALQAFAQDAAPAVAEVAKPGLLDQIKEWALKIGAIVTALLVAASTITAVLPYDSPREWVDKTIRFLTRLGVIKKTPAGGFQFSWPLKDGRDS